MYGTTVGTPTTATSNTNSNNNNSNVDLEAQQSIDTNGNLIGNSIDENGANSEETPLNGNNENVVNYSENDELTDGARLLDVMELARACRLIRLFAIIDCVLMILFAFWGDLLFLAGVPLAICGYFGAKNLKRGALVCNISCPCFVVVVVVAVNNVWTRECYL